jgi:hypothetical protein
MTFLDPGARAPVDIQVRLRGGQGGDPFAALPDWQAPTQKAQDQAPGAPPTGDPFQALPDWNPEAQQQPAARDIGTGEAVGRGAAEMLTFGLGPAAEGLAAAAGPEWNQSQAAHDFAPVVGAAKMLGNVFSSHPDKTVKEAYERGRKAAAEDQRLASEQHPLPFLAGQLGAAIALPIPGIGGGASVTGRLAQAASRGAVGGGALSAGQAVSEGQSPQDVALAGAEGAGTGALFGGAAGGALEGLGGLGSKVLGIARGVRDVETEASRRVASALQSDLARQGQPFTPEMSAAGAEAGTPQAIVDVGGERTRALARSAANTSPEARSALEEMTSARFAQQSPRVAGFIRNMTGGGNAADDAVAIENAAREANRPAYQRAYAAGDKQIWSPELERLTAAPYVQRALSGAISKWKNYAVRDGYGAMNPPFRIEGGGLIKTGGKGLPAYPNIQLWDYAARELQDKARAAPPGSQSAGLYNDLARQLKNELDSIVPEYGAARGTAKMFFGAENALEAGQKFVMSGMKIPDAIRGLQQFSPVERELFARGFASDLADKIERTNDRQNVINSVFLNNDDARKRIALALGPERAAKLEALLRVETVVDKARQALGNSTTARQLAEMGLAGGGVAAFEGLKEHDVSIPHVIAGALIAGAAHRGVKLVDERVAARVGELLASTDPGALDKGIAIVRKSPVLFDALRAATGGVARVGAQDIGARKAAAAIGAAYAKEE